MQRVDLIPVTALLGCSEPDLLLNSLVGGRGPARGRGGLPRPSSMGQPSVSTASWLVASSIC